ncbi:Hypothetical protein UVM_LOCUS89 [uncultured virus]|nr:Hypothetical protein UVM_LOCUS89 [uncultured virus]
MENAEAAAAKQRKLALKQRRARCDVIQTASETVGRALDKIAHVKDPVARFSMVTLAVDILTDVAFGLLLRELDDHDDDYECDYDIEYVYDAQEDQHDADAVRRGRTQQREAETRRSVQEARRKMGGLFESLSDYIATPTYSPDHPVGSEMMARASSEFHAAHSGPSPAAVASPLRPTTV